MTHRQLTWVVALLALAAFGLLMACRWSPETKAASSSLTDPHQASGLGSPSLTVLEASTVNNYQGGQLTDSERAALYDAIRNVSARLNREHKP